MNCVGLSVVFGCSGAMDTLVAQAHGAYNVAKATAVTLRCLVACLVMCIPTAVAWLYCKEALMLLGVREESAKYGALYAKVCL